MKFQQVCGNSSLQETQKPKAVTQVGHTISRNQQITCVLHLEKVFSIVRRRFGLSPTDQMKVFDVNTAIWCVFISVTLQAAVHLGKDYTESLRSTKEQPLKSSRQLISSE